MAGSLQLRAGNAAVQPVSAYGADSRSGSCEPPHRSAGERFFGGQCPLPVPRPLFPAAACCAKHSSDLHNRRPGSLQNNGVV